MTATDTRGRPIRRRHAGMPSVAPLIAELRRRLDARGMSQRQLAASSGVSEATISRILSGGTAAPSYVELSVLLLHLGIAPNEAAAILGLCSGAAS